MPRSKEEIREYNRQWATKWRENNREKYNAYQTTWREKNVDKLKARHRKKLKERQLDGSLRWYVRGMPPHQFEAMWQQQEGRCAICGIELIRHSRQENSVCIDHNHACCLSGRSCGRCNRGLLCKLCNSGIGMFRDSPLLLQNAIEYLRSFL